MNLGGRHRRGGPANVCYGIMGRKVKKERKCGMIEQFAPNHVTHELGENGCCLRHRKSLCRYGLRH